jgi:acetyl/propionyl-CoA carboxylase alpha subunit
MAKVLLQAEGHHEPTVVTVVRGDDDGVMEVSVGATRHECRAESDENGGGRLLVKGRVVPFHAVRDGDHVLLWLGGRTYAFDIVRPGGRRAGGVGGEAAFVPHLSAPMPGTILKVQIGAGDRFEPHQPLVVIESMKMEMTLSAPHPGQVREIRCKVGELVDAGAVLMTFDESKGEGDDAA